jgi:hypothetical protein
VEDSPAEVEEGARQAAVAGEVERVGDERAVARPQVAVVVRGAQRHVRVVGGEDGPAVVNLRAGDEQRALVEADDLRRQVAEVGLVLVDPRAPVVFRPLHEPARPARHDARVEVGHLAVGRAGREPVEHLGRLARADDESAPDGRVDGAFRDRAFAEHAVLGVAPRPLRPLERLAPGGESLHAGGRVGGDQKVAQALVVNQRARVRVEVGRVADLGLGDVKVLVEEEAELAARARGVGQPDAADEDVFVRVHGVVRDDFDVERAVDEPDLRDEGLVQVIELARPAGVRDPGERAFDPEAEAERVALGMVLLADVREVDVTNLVQLVERDQQRAVSDGDVTGHKINAE